MFKQINADVPLVLPGIKGCIHADLDIETDTGNVMLRFEDEPFAYRLLMQIRYNNLLTLDLAMKYINDDPEQENKELTELEQAMVDKLTDAGCTKEQAETLVRDVVMAAEERGRR